MEDVVVVVVLVVADVAVVAIAVAVSCHSVGLQTSLFFPSIVDFDFQLVGIF